MSVRALSKWEQLLGKTITSVQCLVVEAGQYKEVQSTTRFVAVLLLRFSDESEAWVTALGGDEDHLLWLAAYDNVSQDSANGTSSQSVDDFEKSANT